MRVIGIDKKADKTNIFLTDKISEEIRLKNMLDSTFFNHEFVRKRHKSNDRRAESDILLAFLSYASEWRKKIEFKRLRIYAKYNVGIYTGDSGKDYCSS